MCPHPLLLLFIVTIKVPFILLTMMSSMNGLNTSRLIVILSVIIVHGALKLFLVSLKDQLADIFIKSLPKGMHSWFSWKPQVGLTSTFSLREAVNVYYVMDFKLIKITCITHILILHSYLYCTHIYLYHTHMSSI